MQTTLHKAATRGHKNYGWLNTHHTFSFANYFNPERVNFGNLRVLNDDVIAPGTGFDKHPHDNMEIVSIPLSGSIIHEDSMGNQQSIGENEVQVMSAGTGIFHSEYNASGSKDANFLQLWILPEKKNINPTYSQLKFDPEMAQNSWQVLVDQNKGPLKLNQQVRISRVFLTNNQDISYHLNYSSKKAYVFVIEGSITISDSILNRRDGLGMENVDKYTLKAITDSYILNIEV